MTNRKACRVLWLVNRMLPAYARAKEMSAGVREGWLDGLFGSVCRPSEEEAFTLGVCFPAEQDGEAEEIDGVTFYPFAENLKTPERYDRRMETRFREILDEFAPDIVHVFGTEFPHAFAMAKAFQKPDRLLTGLQGICSEIAKDYRAGLPDAVWNRVTLRDALKRDSLKQQQEKFRLRGIREKETLLLSGHITGRTAFDRTFARKLAPQAAYHPMNETMRRVFYEAPEGKAEVRKHQIFVSQADYPLKGFHFLLRVLPRLVKEFPGTRVVVAGNPVIRDRLRIGAYGEYLQVLIDRGKLSSRIGFSGTRSAEQMRALYRESHVFVCPSFLENSPNSVAEAMLSGTPVIASDTGGIPSMLTDGEDGLLFARGDAKALYEAVRRVFSDNALSARLSENARRRALRTHNGEKNAARLREIYRMILGETK